MTISCCIIARNEEDNISDCIKSVVDIVDEVIVLDTGSNDETIKIANSFDKVKVYETNWHDDNSLARNECISYATKDWILVLDADERLKYSSKNQLLSILEQYQKDDNVLLLFKTLNLNPYSTFKSYFKTSLFKNNSYFKYIRPIHDYPVNFKTNETRSILINEINILHNNGSTLEELKIKANSYIVRLNNIINVDLENIDNDYYYKHLGDSYFLLGENSKAYYSYKKSLDLLSKKKDYKQSRFYNLLISRIKGIENETKS